jgi:chromosome segregation ATPase
MPDNFDLKKLIEQGTKRVTLNDLAQRGFENVKVLDEDAIHQMILDAIDRSLSMQTAEQRQNLAEQSRRELDRLMREHKEMRGHAQLLESDKNELIAQVEALANELRLKEEMEEETLHKKLQEGLASLQGQVEELKSKTQAAQSDAQAAKAEAGRLQDDKARKIREIEELKARQEDARQSAAQARQQQAEIVRLTADRDRLQREAEERAGVEKELQGERAKSRGAEQARVDLVQQVLNLQSKTDGQDRELQSLRPEIVRQRSELARLGQELERARVDGDSVREQVAKGQEMLRRAEQGREDSGRRVEEMQAALERTTAEAQKVREERSRLAEAHSALSGASEVHRTELETLRQAETRLRSELENERETARLAQASRFESGRQVQELEEEVGTLGAQAERLKSDLAQLASVRTELENLRPRLEQAERVALQSQSEAERLQVERAALAHDADSRKADLARRDEEIERSTGTAIALRARVQELEAERTALVEAKGALDSLRPRLEKAERDAEEARQEIQSLREERADLVHEAGTRQQHLEKLTVESGEFTKTLQALRITESSLHSRVQDLEAERAVLAEARGALDSLRPRLDKAEQDAEEARQEIQDLRDERADLVHEAGTRQQHLEKLTVESGEFAKTLQALRITETSLRTRVQELEKTHSALAQAAEERDQVREQLEDARQETAFIKGQLAQQQADHESERGKTVMIAAELQEIEDLQKAEKKEAERLYADQERLGRDLEASREEVRALQDLLAREQEAARVAQNDSASLQARIADAGTRSTGLERDLEALRVDNARLQERTAVANLEGRLGDLETLILTAKENSATAKDSAEKSRGVTLQLERALARQLQPKGKPKSQGSIRGGAAFDGMAVLENFLRKIRLREHFQKYIPVTERPGRLHPSEMMVEVLKSIVAGQGKGPEGRSLVPLEVVGGTNAPDEEALRQFLGGLSSQAVRALANVHHALRLHLTPLPRKPHALTLDVTTVELGKGNRRYRPVIAYDPESREFWNGQLRGNQDLTKDGMRDYLAFLIGRVPKPFARNRVRVRMDESFFNEGVVRLLESKKVSYVIAAPDSPSIRKESRARAYHKLSNGWEVAEFLQRLHPIRHTQARFVVLRRRRSQEADKAGRGTFRDDRHVYHVFAVDRAATPWRSFEIYAARPQSVADARSRLAEFETSPLLGRTRRSVTALFQAHLLASDLIQWFRRGCLPEEDRSRELPELRSEFLWTPSRTGSRSLLVLPRKDRRRRLFSRVTGLTRRVRPARPFRYRS